MSEIKKPEQDNDIFAKVTFPEQLRQQEEQAQDAGIKINDLGIEKNIETHEDIDIKAKKDSSVKEPFDGNDLEFDKLNSNDVVLSLDDLFSQQYHDIVDYLESKNVEYRPIQKVDTPRTESEIIANLGGGDLTKGSCSSLALAYAGNVAGFDVKDFRDGESRIYFSDHDSIQKISELSGVKSTIVYGSDDIKCANELLQKMEPEKEYYLGTGSHASIVRQHETKFEYLELQSPDDCGWHTLNNDELKSRFDCVEVQEYQYPNFLIEVESLSQSQEFQMILGYINTSEGNQKKGVSGYAR